MALHARAMRRYAWSIVAVAALVAAPPGLCGADAAPSVPDADRLLEVTPETRRAIDRGLEFLAAQQDADGSWQGAMGKNTGVASFAVLSYLATGAVPGRGVRGRIVCRGVDFVLTHAQWNGLISNGAQTSGNGPMYEHAMSTLMLAEVWGAYERPGLRDALERAVQLIVSSQNDQGGWRYEPRPADADVSVTVMQLVALRAAKNAGIEVPRRVFDGAVRYVRSCAKPSGGFLYQPGIGEEGYARTAAGVCSLLVGGDHASAEVLNGLRYLQERKARARRGDDHLHYALYYAAQAMYQAPDPRYFAEWYAVAREELIGLQEPDGHWEGEAGPIYGTAFSVLALSVPYRYLPVYQH